MAHGAELMSEQQMHVAPAEGDSVPAHMSLLQLIFCNVCARTLSRNKATRRKKHNFSLSLNLVSLLTH